MKLALLQKARHFTTYLTVFKLLKRSVYFRDKMEKHSQIYKVVFDFVLYDKKVYSYAVYTFIYCCATLFVILSIQMYY